MLPEDMKTMFVWNGERLWQLNSSYCQHWQAWSHHNRLQQTADRGRKQRECQQTTGCLQDQNNTVTEWHAPDTSIQLSGKPRNSQFSELNITQLRVRWRWIISDYYREMGVQWSLIYQKWWNAAENPMYMVYNFFWLGFY